MEYFHLNSSMGISELKFPFMLCLLWVEFLVFVSYVMGHISWHIIAITGCFVAVNL